MYVCVFDLPLNIMFQSVALVKHMALSMLTWPPSFFKPSGNGTVSFSTSLKKIRCLSPVILYTRGDQHVSAWYSGCHSLSNTARFDWPPEFLVSIVRAFERQCGGGHVMVFKCHLFWTPWVNKRFKTHMTLLYTPTRSHMHTYTHSPFPFFSHFLSRFQVQAKQINPDFKAGAPR